MLVDDISDKVYVSKKTNKIKLKIKLEDKMTTSNIKKSYKLKKGNNKIKIIVKAENGLKRKYIINVYRKKGIFI